MLSKKTVVQWFIVLLLSIGVFSANAAFAETESGSADSAQATDGSDRSQVLSTFIGKDRAVLVDSFDERREQHKILFYMGVLLLISILATAGFGVSMAMLGKEVFVPHMIFAGITVFLSIAHAVVAVVWFFPF